MDDRWSELRRLRKGETPIKLATWEVMTALQRAAERRAARVVGTRESDEAPSHGS